MSNFALRVKTKEGQHVLNTLGPESTIKELKTKLADIAKTATNRLSVLSGYPPKAFDISQDDVSLSKSGLSSGETLIIEEKKSSEVLAEEAKNEEQLVQAISEQQAHCQGLLLKQVVPADNSCLFTSMHYVLNGKVADSTEVAPWLRNLIAESIQSQKEEYTEAVLGKPVDEYCAWIKDDKSWGGAIELSVLSKYYGIEIAVVDTINAIINRFGEDQSFPHRVFLMFDGIHYDPLYLESFEDSSIKTIFPSEDEEVYKQAEQIAKEAKASRQFTDVNKFTLKCIVCGTHLKGQVEAQQHAMSTSHTNFGEI